MKHPHVIFQQQHNHVHVCAYSLPKTVDKAQILDLSPEEQRILMNITSPTFYYQQFWSFVLTRTVLADVLKCHVNDLKIHRNGKPYLTSHQLFFNISHSDHIWAIAWSFEGEVGIDVQKIDPGVNYQAIMRQFFTEKDRLNTHDHLDFFRLWTQKEALIKLHGGTVVRMGNFEDPTALVVPLSIHPQFMAHLATQDV